MEPKQAIQSQWVARFTEYLAERLKEHGTVGDRELTSRTLELTGYIGTSDSWLVTVTLEGDAVRIAAPPAEGGPETAHMVRTLADLDACFPEIAAAASALASRLTPHALRKGSRYRIARAFTDHHGNEFSVGEELVFDELHFLPYHDGYTICFVERKMYIEGGSEQYAHFGLNVVPA